jgi:hypothetical protein
MKKLFLTAALAGTCLFTSAQDMMSKRGTPILPEAGDWSIGADATSLIQYFGNLFTDANNNNSSLNSQVPQTLVGLYVVDANTAYRAKLRIGFGSQTLNNIVDDNSTTTEFVTVTDELKRSSTNFALGFGLQKSRGKGRLHGIYGAEAGFGIGSSKDSYSYGNAITTTNSSPTSTDDWTNLPNPGTALSTRTTESKSGSTFSINLNAFIGAEYFFAPKMSLSAEYGWGLLFSSTGEGETSSERLNVTGTAVETFSASTGKSSNINLDVADIGSIVLHFYF